MALRDLAGGGSAAMPKPVSCGTARPLPSRLRSSASSMRVQSNSKPRVLNTRSTSRVCGRDSPRAPADRDAATGGGRQAQHAACVMAEAAGAARILQPGVGLGAARCSPSSQYGRRWRMKRSRSSALAAVHKAGRCGRTAPASRCQSSPALAMSRRAACTARSRSRRVAGRACGSRKEGQGCTSRRGATSPRRGAVELAAKAMAVGMDHGVQRRQVAADDERRGPRQRLGRQLGPQVVDHRAARTSSGSSSRPFHEACAETGPWPAP